MYSYVNFNNYTIIKTYFLYAEFNLFRKIYIKVDQLSTFDISNE